MASSRCRLGTPPVKKVCKVFLINDLGLYFRVDRIRKQLVGGGWNGVGGEPVFVKSCKKGNGKGPVAGGWFASHLSDETAKDGLGLGRGQWQQ
jgi:hypothetical protein